MRSGWIWRKTSFTLNGNVGPFKVKIIWPPIVFRGGEKLRLVDEILTSPFFFLPVHCGILLLLLTTTWGDSLCGNKGFPLYKKHIIIVSHITV